jgi:hypothetical protein
MDDIAFLNAFGVGIVSSSSAAGWKHVINTS